MHDRAGGSGQVHCQTPRRTIELAPDRVSFTVVSTPTVTTPNTHLRHSTPMRDPVGVSSVRHEIARRGDQVTIKRSI